nr:MAG TPA: hypothetical protein [Caudoviricetes sp.]
MPDFCAPATRLGFCGIPHEIFLAFYCFSLRFAL